jgi:hypothetical protein
VNSLLRVSCASILGGLIASAAPPGIVSDDVPLGFLPREWVTGTLQKTLSPRGRYSFLTPTGPVRVSDEPEKVAAARRALDALQKAPALVPIELQFTTTAQRTVQRRPLESPVSGVSIPVPDRYDPPRVMSDGAGNYTVVPSQPRSFTTRKVGPGTVLNPSGTGYTTATPEARNTETATATIGARRFQASTVPGRPVAISVLRSVPDPAALHALARKYDAIPDGEPVWSAAGTDFSVEPRLADGALVVNVVPHIVLPATPSQAARRIPIGACAAGILVARGAPPSKGLLPRSDPEFYRVFLGAPQATDETLTSLTVGASVQYVGSPPK